jgi:hypothetical protein
MQRLKVDAGKFYPAHLLRSVGIGMLLAGCLTGTSLAQHPGQRTFSSAEEASNALVAATQNNDEKAMLEILGPDGKRIVSSGDEAEDASGRATFVQRYQQMHRLVNEPDGTTTLYIGAENWPTPIPLMKKGSSWYFDTEAAEDEILFRRIGGNEMSAARVCEELAAAQKEYSAQHNEYAQKIFSDDAQHNGLYWKAGQGEPQSPIGPLLAAAVADSKAPGETPTPFRGYYFRMLTRQGKDAPGGAKDYIVSGKMTAGFAFVAYPAEYRSSGVMTFMVGEDGIVYEKDLGKKTEGLAKSMKEYKPNPGWWKTETPQEQAAGDQGMK